MASHHHGHAFSAGVGCTGKGAGVGGDMEGVDEGQAAVAVGDVNGGMAFVDFVEHPDGDAALAADGVELTVEAGGMHGLLDIHAKIDDVEDHLQDGGDDAGGAGRSEDEEGLRRAVG